jgi:hypothetical protein
MATPRVLGQELRLTANLCLARDASVNFISECSIHSFRSPKRTQQGLVGSSTSRNDTNHSSCTALDDLLCARWELDTGLALIWVMANNGNVVARCASKSSTVTNLLLHVCDNSSFRDGAKREDVSDCEVGVLAGVDELTSVHALVRDEGLGVKLESVGIAEDNLCERGSSAGIMDDCGNAISTSPGVTQCSMIYLLSFTTPRT